MLRSLSRSAAFGCAVLIAAIACSTVRTSSDYDPAAHFASYHTYAWLPEPPRPTGHPRADSPILHDRIHNSIDRTLAAKGFTLDPSNPDFMVAYNVSAEQKLDVRTYDQDFYGPYGYPVSIPQTDVTQYEEGTLIIDVVDAKAKKVVWRGVGSRRLQPQSGQQDPTQLEQRVFETVSQTLATFPPQPKS